MAQIATLSHVAQDKEPSCQKISWASSTSDAPHCMNASRALKVNSIAIPTRIIAMCETPRSLENMEKERSTQGKDKCFRGHKQTACNRNYRPTKSNGQWTVDSAAPKLAPEEKPKVKGSADGLFKIVYISAPASPSMAPTNAAINATGRRYFQIIISSFGLASDRFKMTSWVRPKVRSDRPTITSKTVMTTREMNARKISKSRFEMRRL